MTGASALPSGRFGPAVTGGSGRAGPRPSRVLLAALAVVVALALMAGGAAAALVWYGQAELNQIAVDSLHERGTSGDDGASIEEAEGIINVLAIGSDSREGLSDDDLRQIGTERDDGMRTDTIMLVQLDMDREQASLLSFPRDLLVTRCDGSEGRINAAYAIGEQDGRGGPDCLVETVTEVTGVPIHHYVEVDFAGFIDVVDALGGVSVWLDEPLEDRYAGVDLAAGCQELDGATALGFVRSRHADPEGDFARMERQQRFLQAVLDEAVSMGTVVNMPRLFDLVGSAARAVETDQDLTLGQMRQVAFSMRGIDPEELDVYTVPGHNRKIDGQWLVVRAEPEAQALFAAFRRAGEVPEGVGQEPPGDVEIDDVPAVHVRDGTGTPGLADDVAVALEDEGFEIAGTSSAATDAFEVTQIVHEEGLREEAAVVAEALGGAGVVPADEDEPLTVLIGADLDETVVARAGGGDGGGAGGPGGPGGAGGSGGPGGPGGDGASPTPTPSPSPSPSPATSPSPVPDAGTDLARARC